MYFDQGFGHILVIYYWNIRQDQSQPLTNWLIVGQIFGDNMGMFFQLLC